MPDHFYGKIEIPARFIKGDVLAAVRTEIIEKELEEKLLIAGNNGIIKIEDDRASNGQFDDLEGELRKNNVPFERTSSQHYEYSAETCYFRPESACGRPVIHETFSEEETGDPYIVVTELKKLLSLDAESVKAKLQEMVTEICVFETSPLSDWATGKIKPAASQLAEIDN